MALVTQKRLEVWGSRGALRGSGDAGWQWDGEKGKDVQRDRPLRTALMVLPAAQPFEERVIPVLFKLLQCPDDRWCGPKSDTGWDLDSDLLV